MNPSKVEKDLVIAKAAVHKGPVLWVTHLNPGLPLNLGVSPRIDLWIATILLLIMIVLLGSLGIARSAISSD